MALLYLDLWCCLIDSAILSWWQWSQATHSGEGDPSGEDCSSGAFSSLSCHLHLCLLPFPVHRIKLFTFRCSRSRTRPEGQGAQEGNTPHSQRPLLTPPQCHLLVSFSLFHNPKCSTKLQIVDVLLQSPQPNPTQFSPLTFILLFDYINLTFALFISCNIRQIIASCYSFHISTFDRYTILLPAPMDNPL